MQMFMLGGMNADRITLVRKTTDLKIGSYSQLGIARIEVATIGFGFINKARIAFHTMLANI